MAFTLIKGNFKPLAGLPDGDSVRFKADNLSLFNNLEGRRVEIGTGVETLNTVQLRFEGIDAIEKAATKPLSVQAKENMFRHIGFNANTNPEPRGYILTRMTDPHGRPITYAFAGTTPKPDGSSIFLDPQLLGKSVNYLQVKDGFAYPLYYNTLFASLRKKFDSALAFAKQHRSGYWPSDKTSAGVNIQNADSIKTIPPIWPKLWRRLQEYTRHHTSMNGFIQFLEDKNERLLILPIIEERGLQDIVKVTGKKVSLTVKPENLIVITEIARN